MSFGWHLKMVRPKRATFVRFAKKLQVDALPGNKCWQFELYYRVSDMSSRRITKYQAEPNRCLWPLQVDPLKGSRLEAFKINALTSSGSSSYSNPFAQPRPGYYVSYNTTGNGLPST